MEVPTAFELHLQFCDHFFLQSVKLGSDHPNSELDLDLSADWVVATTARIAKTVFHPSHAPASLAFLESH